MSASGGTRLGPYQLLARLGAGGMGEVWRARDTRLDRDVAVKILSPAMAGDSQLRLRLDREGKTISQLSHPHICALYDVGDGYLVMELIEGETLASRIARGPLPMSEVLRLGEQIAEALHAAHRRGIVHRDLKPGNIMLTRSGAKLLDFGLARSRAPMIGADAETEQRSITEEGAIVGTLQYMAPEQLDGKEADARTDVFALGAVIYEMATGRRAFGGQTRTSVISAIASADPPPMTQLQPLAPARLEQVVRGCLAKDPDQRTQSAHDVAQSLRWIANDNGATAVKQRPVARERIAWGLAALLSLVVTAGLVDRVRQRPASSSPLRFTIPAPPQTAIYRTAAISPDGKRVVYRALGGDGRSSLWLRSLDSLEAKELDGTEQAAFVFWSPDSKHIGFFGGGKLKRLDTSDGAIRTIYEPTDNIVGGATWNQEDVIVFSPKIEGGLYRVAASGGEAVSLAGKDQPIHAWPSFLPDGRHFLYSAIGKDNHGGVMVGSLDSAESKMVLPFRRLYELTPAYYGGGHLFYLRKRALLAQAFDPAGMKLSGAPIQIAEGIDVSGPARSPLSVSSNGTVVYRKAGAPTLMSLTVVDRAGRKLRALHEPGPYLAVAVSPEGKRLLLSRDDEVESIWEVDLDRGSSGRVTFEEESSTGVWLRDGKAFTYSGSTDSPPNVYLRRADGSITRLTKTTEQNYPTGVAPDGSQVVYTAAESGRNWNIYSVTTTAPHLSTPLRNTPFGEGDGVVSPDGRWLAYTSNESGPWQVYVTHFPKPAGRWPVSTAVGDNPRWSADGREIYYSDHKRLFAVKVRADGEEFRAGLPEPLFELPSTVWDVFPDGSFLIGERAVNPNSPPLSVIVNWRP